jgi:hypothetical protein
LAARRELDGAGSETNCEALGTMIGLEICDLMELGRMRKTTVVLLAGVALLGAGCTNPYDPGQRALGGAGIGALSGAAIGGLAGGGHGAAIGALAGGATGALVGAATTPTPPPPAYGYGYPPPGYVPAPEPSYGYGYRK